MSETVQANDGAMLPLDSLATQLFYSGGFISTISVIYAGKTYVQTFLNNGTNIIYISGWVTSSAPAGQQVMVDQSGNIMVDQSGNIMVTQ
jgi:hypothetical protein